MTRIKLSDALFYASRCARIAPTTVRLAVERTVRRAACLAAQAIADVGALVRGCGCDDDDPESCSRKRETDRTYQTWCRCDCHDANVHLRAAEAEEN